MLAYRSPSKTWEGQSKFIQIDGEAVVGQTGSRRKIFRSLHVKPMACSEVHKPGDMNIPCDGIFSIDPKMTDQDFADEKACALVSNTSQNDKRIGQVLNDGENNRRKFCKDRK